MPGPSAFLRALVDFALPPRCPACGVVVEGDHRFCIDCWQAIDFLDGAGCASCGVPMPSQLGAGAACASCLAEPPAHDGVRAVAAYGDVARSVVMKLKYGRKPGMARIVALHLHRRFDPADDALLVPVPLHRWRLWSRGFNQSALIGRSLAARTGLPLAIDAIRRVKATPSLRGLTRVQRARAVRGVFALTEQGRAQIAGRVVYLVDDVYTSGATAGACAKLLKRGGASRVVVLCWARVLPVDEPAY
jgi:ComF family protein